MIENILTIYNTEKISDGKTAASWFNTGERLVYDLSKKQILKSVSSIHQNQLYVFNKHVTYPNQSADSAMTFLPGFPNGSIDWIKIDKLLETPNPLNRTFVGYIGQGDSDKPKEYNFSTFERADLVEAIWKTRRTRSTFTVTFDYS